ncbi:MAG: hypothetical protein IKU51_04380 [Clostridia bacterium]|nr:hypothetical protein [Clostridia bacterium]
MANCFCLTKADKTVDQYPKRGAVEDDKIDKKAGVSYAYCRFFRAVEGGRKTGDVSCKTAKKGRYILVNLAMLYDVIKY